MRTMGLHTAFVGPARPLVYGLLTRKDVCAENAEACLGAKAAAARRAARGGRVVEVGGGGQQEAAAPGGMTGLGSSRFNGGGDEGVGGSPHATATPAGSGLP